MKTEAEIRRHLADLCLADQTSCGCAGTQHEEKCRRGADMMRVSINVLSWVLGQAPQYDEIVEGLREFNQRRN